MESLYSAWPVTSRAAEAQLAWRDVPPAQPGQVCSERQPTLRLRALPQQSLGIPQVRMERECLVFPKIPVTAASRLGFRARLPAPMAMQQSASPQLQPAEREAPAAQRPALPVRP